MAVHAAPPQHSAAALRQVVIDGLAGLQRTFVLLGVFCFALAFSVLAVTGQGNRTITIQWSPEAPSSSAPVSAAPAP